MTDPIEKAAAMDEAGPKWRSDPASASQKATIARLGGDPEAAATKGEAHALIDELARGPSEIQKKYIRDLGGDPEGIETKEEAHEIIDRLLAGLKPTANEIRALEGKGFRSVANWNRKQAEDMLGALRRNRWRVPAGIDPRTYRPGAA